MTNPLRTTIAVITGLLAIGGALTLATDTDAATKGGDLVVTLVLATVAVVAWRGRSRATRPARSKEARPWER